jgi:hypothetical protein
VEHIVNIPFSQNASVLLTSHHLNFNDVEIFIITLIAVPEEGAGFEY